MMFSTVERFARAPPLHRLFMSDPPKSCIRPCVVITHDTVKSIAWSGGGVKRGGGGGGEGSRERLTAFVPTDCRFNCHGMIYVSAGKLIVTNFQLLAPLVLGGAPIFKARRRGNSPPPPHPGPPLATTPLLSITHLPRFLR